MSKNTANSEKIAGYFHGTPITEDQVIAAAETLYAESYGDLANLHNGRNHVLHLYIDGSAQVKLEDRMTETHHGEFYGAPVISCFAELPEWADGAAAQEAFDENCKADLIAFWADAIRQNLDEAEE